MAKTMPIILTATMGAADFAWADAQRRAHFPAERNLVPAHITLFHHLPPSLEEELIGRLRRICAEPAPAARIGGILRLGGGVAYRVESPALLAIRDTLAEAFGPLLQPQDQARPRLHITIQNKVPPQAARRLADALEAGFRPRPLVVAGLAAWYYAGGPWQPIRSLSFRGRP
ncbi:2'-5' RNA ligase family protein [Flavisphingomonas formosensis]|uniref:2'-5' RNA ligase family protein n=1 Tax=Flavisphingomonas formosensis TaxID=861534 RepID=UPI0012FC85D0|nr:2'-5' RNA ligase family protein [Sphingomonas formosensis]